VKVVGRAYLGLGALIAVLAALYWFTSYEDAGTAMLLLAACLAVFMGGYLALGARRATLEAGENDVVADEAEPYLPHASIWPFFIGVAALLTLNGVVLGLWALVPGAVALSGALVGYAGQSRQRG